MANQELLERIGALVAEKNKAITAITIAQQIKEVEAEIKMREYVYGNKVIAGTMSSQQKDFKINTMKAVLSTLKGLQCQ